MLKLHDAVFPARSVAIHDKIWVPTLKVVTPNCGQYTLTLPLLSVAVASFQVTTPVAAFTVVKAVILIGQVMTGGVKSATSTWKLQLAEFPDVSEAVHVTNVDPNTKFEPVLGLQLTDCTATLSVAVAVG